MGISFYEAEDVARRVNAADHRRRGGSVKIFRRAGGAILMSQPERAGADR
jgi:hypothetical protein